ncbi:MAG: CDP-diacylglycerol--glycerol-3-phosphate 3-phosphatidyltransferase [Clostridia bacterium]|nr:CDP-diacylglycerol--glycerol-3-phosphate 3-phosphatidyltransferase [Clostridia bacterium]
MKLNLANKLTIFRIILVPIMALIPYLNLKGDFFGLSLTFFWMELIFIVASITDKLDGYIARSRNQITTFGKFLDPLADKILVLTAMVLLVELDKIPAWIPIIVLAREFLVSGYRLIAVEKGGQVIAASFWGKLKTVTQMIAIILVIFDANAFAAFFNGYLSGAELYLNIVSTTLLFVSVVATIFSGIDYMKNGKELFED